MGNDSTEGVACKVTVPGSEGGGDSLQPTAKQHTACGDRNGLGGEVGAEEFGLFEDGFGGFFLFVGRVAVLAEDASAFP